MRKTIAILATAIALCFAQGVPPKIAVYVSGASDESINKSLSSKLLAALAQSGEYAGIANPEAFQDELANSKKGTSFTMQTAKRYGAVFVCIVNITEALGEYYISARIINDSQTIKTGSMDSPSNSFYDLAKVSSELAALLAKPSQNSAVSISVPTPPKKFAVYVSGASDEGLNKTLGNKILSTIVKSDKYTEIENLEAFYKELVESGKTGNSQISDVAKQYGADFVCVVNMTEVFGVHSISARIIETTNSQTFKTGSVDSPLNSFDDIIRVSNTLVALFFNKTMPPQQTQASPNAATVAPFALQTPATIDRVAAAQEAAKKQCTGIYNINELVFRLEYKFPRRLKDCAKKAAHAFIRQCTADGIKEEIPFGFPSADKLVLIFDNFTQSILNEASAGGILDTKKFISAVHSINMNEPLNDIKKLAFSDKCIVNEPYYPIDAYTSMAGYSEESDSDDDEGKKSVSFGIRAGLNFSIASENEYAGFGSGTLGMRLGFVLDIAATDWFNIQPGLIYIQKKMNDFESKGGDFDIHTLELPAIMSFKIPWLRSLRVGESNIPGKLNIGPYIGVCLSNYCNFDIGLSGGLRFDIGMFYIDSFYDHSFIGEILDGYGFNLGVNL